MSAYIVNPEVIARLANQLARKEAVKIASALIDENIKSIECRYPDSKGAAIPYFMNYTDSEYRDVVNTLLNNPGKLADFPSNERGDAAEYDYQACEHQGYETSQVKRWIDSL